MTTRRLVGISVLVFAAACTAAARAEDISTKRMFIKDHADAAKRQLQVLSKDAGVQRAKADDPRANGAAIHVYSATDDLCLVLGPGTGWVSKPNVVKYKSKATKSALQVKDGKLVIAVRSGVAYSLADDGRQGAVNVQVRFGTGTRFCMRCTGNKKDTAQKFLGTKCAAAPCDPEPSSCDTVAATTTSTTLEGGQPSTTTLPSPTAVLLGALAATPGRFNYNLTVGLPGANAACNTTFPGTHACTHPELQSAEAAGELAGLKDLATMTVTSFWVIDASPTPSLTQCVDDAAGGSNLNWEYGTAHTASRGTHVDLNNAAGTLGAISAPEQCNFSSRWVGCCQ